jgi:WD40 repeat protein
VCYGVFVYFRRIHLINTGKAYGYVDYVGPILLACCVLGSVIVLSYFIFHTAIPDSEVVQPSIHSEHGLCEKYTFTELSDLEFQPSDVVVDAERKILLIPSLTTIVSVPLYQVTVSVPEVLIDIPGADIEALTAVGDRLFAVREDGDSTIHELQWDAGRLRKVREFLIPTNHVEGITFVPDSKESSTVHLYVAGSDRKTQRVSVDVYQIPSSPDTSNGYATVEVLNLTKRSLNANLLTNGLEDPKIASLAYFEDLLYVLHDNDRLVRSWDVKKGKMLAEWKLPHVVGGFAKQWEGMALERRSDCSQTASSALLRGWPQEECQSSLYLHLTLDTPPQIWTLTVKEDATANRTLLLPSCAPSFDANYTTIGNQH